MNSSSRIYYWLDFAIRLVVGGVFIYAGVLKIGDPLQFGDKVASFEILPNAMVNSLALGLPVFEILCGVLLIVALLRRPAALAILIVSGIFLIAIVTALARGLTIDCGCFGTGTPTRARMWMDLGRDFAIFLGVLFTYWYAHARTSGTPEVFP
jgi:putative oxidoreductase